MTEEAPVYAAALLLDPSRRIAYIKQNWPKSWYSASIESANQIWLDEYASVDPLAADDIISSSPPTSLTPQRPRNKLNALLDTLKVRIVLNTNIDDFIAFISADAINIDRSTPLE